MNISNKGIELIKKFEGCSLSSYKCPAGVWTIGYGHIKNTKEGMKITLKEANIFLQNDLKIHEKNVEKLVKVPLSQNQFDALVSFEFNVGISNFQKSTLLKKLNKNDFIGASGEFEKWIYANHKPLLGLAKRRKAEKELFLLK